MRELFLQVLRPANNMAVRGFATEVEDAWHKLAASVKSDKAKAELAGLKNSINEMLAKSQAKVRDFTLLEGGPECSAKHHAYNAHFHRPLL